MIQEKDFLYRVPVKTAPITTPKGQIRNPEILVDLEGGEFMHGNILDANSTNKLINQSVKDAVDNKFIENEYVTQVNSITDAINAKAETTALTALEQKVTANTAAIGAKQDAGSYIPYNPEYSNGYLIDKLINIQYGNKGITIMPDFIAFGGEDLNEATTLANNELYFTDRINSDVSTTYSLNGITSTKYNNCLVTSDGTFKPISDFALKTELPTVPTNVSQLTNDSNFITQQDADARYAYANSLNTVNDSISSLRVGLSKKQNKITANGVDITDIETADITKLRTIVINLIGALKESGLIIEYVNIE